jgi:HAD superfamily phosphatase (TIGR01681 family)
MNKTEDFEKEAIDESFNLAAAKHKEGDLEQAEYIYFNILSVNPKHIQSNYNLGTLLAVKGMYKEALAFIGRALVLNPLNPAYWKDYIDCISKISASGNYSSDLKTSVDNFIDTALLYIHNKISIPDQIGKLGKNLNGLNILLLGTCQAEFLLEAGLNSDCNIEHFLFESFPASPLPSFSDLKNKKYDAAVIALTFRHIIGEAVKKIKPAVSGDLFFTFENSADEISAILNECKSIISSLVERIKKDIGNMPVFFLSFLEPQFNYPGYFSSRYEYADPRYFFYELNKILYNLVKNKSNAYFIDLNEIASEVGRFKIQDDYYLNIAHNGYIGQEYFKTEVYLAVYGKMVWQRITGHIKVLRKIDSVKLIIVDLDDTLWRGVAAEEDDAAFSRTEGWPLGFVEALLFFKKRGGILAICSKNDTEQGEKMFNDIWGGRLSLDDFASVKINWNDKSSNISEVLNECNILPENALFIDDNPREVYEVQNKFPQIRCLSEIQLDWRSIIVLSPETQTEFLTEESKNRTSLIKSKIERDKFKASYTGDSGKGGENGIEEDAINGNNGAGGWLYGLGLSQSFCIIRDGSDKNYPRAKELLNKTNQFNTTGKRWSEEDLSLFFKSGGVIICTFLKDNIADNGLIGLALIKENAIEQAVLSCRVFGLGIEYGLLRYALDFIFKKYDSASALFNDTGKNFTCRGYFEKCGFKKDEAENLIILNNESASLPDYPDWLNFGNTEI